jgi:hypothetical protein
MKQERSLLTLEPSSMYEIVALYSCKGECESVVFTAIHIIIVYVQSRSLQFPFSPCLSTFQLLFFILALNKLHFSTQFTNGTCEPSIISTHQVSSLYLRNGCYVFVPCIWKDGRSSILIEPDELLSS